MYTEKQLEYDATTTTTMMIMMMLMYGDYDDDDKMAFDCEAELEFLVPQVNSWRTES